MVKASGRELSLFLLLGTFLSYATTFAIVAKPTPERCGLTRFAVGFCYTVCYAAVVTKTNRVARIFGKAPDGGGGGVAVTRSPRFTTPFYSLVIAAALVSIEVVINILWLIQEPPDTAHIFKIAGERILICQGVSNSFVAGLLYPFLLIFCATLYAFKTRKCPGGFNETRFIFLANAINTVHWIVYVPLYFASTDPEIQAVILAFSLSLSATVQLSCLLLPRVYTVVFKPEKNTRRDVMNRKRDYAVPQTPPNSVVPPATTSTLTAAASEALMSQISCMSAPAGQVSTAPGASIAPSRFSHNALNAVDRVKMSEGQTSLPQSFSSLKNRQMTWSFHSNECGDVDGQVLVGGGGRHRSSSVCRGESELR